MRNAAIAHGWTALAFTVALWAFLSVLILILVWLILAILLTVRPAEYPAPPGECSSVSFREGRVVFPSKLL
ncbi:hypothetical protein ACFVW8_21240 [Streptomyces sp. NPDC058221]|uniref:hypothetical protein n=1 Tax=Streptomyces sp. NPDC058221 TaxID=3346388 RepID=UPI0036E2C68B